MNLRITIFSLVFLMSLAINGVYAQTESCATNLKKAEKLFDDGKLEEMHTTLDGCMRFGFSKIQKIRAYELIIQALLADENYAEAERKMVRLLKMEPTFSTEKKVLSGVFVNLFEQLKTSPIVSIGIYGGPTFTRNVVSEEFGNHNIVDYDGEYTSRTGYHIGILAEFYLTHQLLANVEFAMVHNGYSYELNDALPTTNTGYVEDQTRFDIPLSLKYIYPLGRLSPYLQLGVAPGFVTSNTVVAERVYRDGAHIPVSSADIDVEYKRNSFSLQGFASLGVNYRVKRNTLFVGVRYGAGLLPYVSEDAHYEDPEFSNKYFILDDRFKIHTVTVLAGYTFSFYKLNKKVEKY